MEARLFCKINELECYDWTVYYDDRPYHTNSTSGIVVDNNVRETLRNIDSLLDNTFVPALGSEIHVVPGCPVGMADIRKNYKVKRKPDDGCCNVFSPLPDNYNWISCGRYAIVPSRKALVIIRAVFPADENRQKIVLQNKVESLFPDLTTEEKNQIVTNSRDLDLKSVNIPEAYLQLLLGNLKKPCISYKKLEFKCENELTMDTLYLVYRAGMAKLSPDAEEKFKLQLCALNEHNWRDYPGTIHMLFRDILGFYRNSSTYCASALNSISKIPKAAKELVSSGNNHNRYASQKDFELAQSLMMYAVSMPKDLKFTDMQTLTEKFNEAHISMNSFYNCFNNMVKITPKQFEDES